MKKLDNFSNCLKILKNADFELADNDDIYRTGIIGQFNLTFELAWKALQAVLRVHGADGADTGSPREILQLGYKFNFVENSPVWLLMLKKRNQSVHIYNEEEVDEMIILIRDSFIPAFAELENEPVSGIDKNGMELFYETIDKLKKTHDMAIILVSHDLEYVRKYADEVVLIDRKVLKKGTPASVFASDEFKETFGM